MYFSFAMDESTNVSETARLLIFVRGIHKKFYVYEELLKICSLEGRGFILTFGQSSSFIWLELRLIIKHHHGWPKKYEWSGVVGRINCKLQVCGSEIPVIFH